MKAKAKPERPLNDRMRRVCELVVKGVPAGRAYEQAGYTSRGEVADQAASRLLATVKVAAYLKTLREAASKDAAFGRDDLIGFLVQIIKTPVSEVGHDSRLAQKVKSGKGFDLDDFKAQIAQMRKMGGLSALVDKLPAQLTQAASQSPDLQEKSIRRTEGIINAMTALERRKPELLKATRKRRVAAGAGVHVQEVNRMLNQFEQMRDMMKKMKGGGLMKMMKRMGGMKGMGGMGGMNGPR